MENKRVATLVTMMIVMTMGNLLVQTEAQASPLPPFLNCFPSCLMSCAGQPIQQAFMCPLNCMMKCMSQSTPGSPSTPMPGSPSTPMPGSPTTPMPGSPSNPTPGSPTTPMPGSPSAPGSPSTSDMPPQVTLANKIDTTDYYCKIGCATHHCLHLTSLQNPNVVKVAGCVDSCSNKCSNKN